MNKKVKALIAVGGTGGHVFPGYNLALHLNEFDYNVSIITDKRGKKFLNNFKYFNTTLLPSTPLIKKNFFTILFSSIFIFYTILRALIYLSINRPSIIFGMGGYASFPICVAAIILKVKIIIYENNLILGKTNKYLLPFAEKLLVSYKDLEKVPKKHQNKIYQIGNIIKKEIINFSKKNLEFEKSGKINILVLGGSQAAKIFAETLPNIFRECLKTGIYLKIYQQCLPYQNEELGSFYKSAKIEFEIFNFSNNLIDYFSKANLAITRSGSSMLAELTNANIPFISIPLPSSADNHQYKNANFYKKKNLSFLIEEKNLNNELFHLIKKIYGNYSVLNEIISNQRQYSDKNVYKNVNEILKKTL